MFRLYFIIGFGLCVAAEPPTFECKSSNEIQTACGSPCEEKCPVQNETAHKVFYSSSCMCSEGFARDSNAQCIPRHQCPGNRSSTGCLLGVPAAPCNFDPCEMRECPGNPLVKCKADPCGTCRARWFMGEIEVSNPCLPNYSNFEKNCRPDEEFLKYGPSCEPRCPGDVIGRTDCPKAFVTGCFCKKGLVRTVDNSCIKSEDCNLNKSPGL